MTADPHLAAASASRAAAGESPLAPPADPPMASDAQVAGTPSSPHALPAGPVAVLTNPTAGRGRHAGLPPAVLQRLSATGRDVRLLNASTAEQAQQVCQAAVADGAAALIAVGGDGTIHLALQAVAGTGVAFAPVPAGTGNDFAVHAGFPTDPLAATDVIVEALAAGRTRLIDLARMRDAEGRQRWFGAVLAAGFDAIVNERANGMRWPRGPRRYDLAIVIELARLRPRHYQMRLDGVTHEFDGVLVAVGNTPSYGGGMRICPHADPTDGLLDVVVGGRFTRTGLMRIKPRVYSGTHIDHPQVRTFRAARVELAAEGITAYADGERVGPLPVTVTAVPRALHLLR